MGFFGSRIAIALLYVVAETGLKERNYWANLKSYRHFRAKLNCTEKFIYKTPSNIVGTVMVSFNL